ncbi:MAG: metal-dependent hydrolase [Patescibacteria group bacterium]
MTARTHDAFAFASLVTIATFMPPQNLNLLTLAVAIVANIVGALIPDMDQAGNRLWDLLPAGDTLGKVFRRIFYKHRTLSHSFLGAFIIFKFLEFILPKVLNEQFVNPEIILWSIMIGYFSHLIADALTKDGLPLFFPFTVDIGFPPIRALRVTTGKWVENYVVLPSVAVYIMWFIYTHQTQLVEILRNIKV